jgi:hypothetical protein
MPLRPPIATCLLLLPALLSCGSGGFLQPTTGAIQITTTTTGQPDPDGYTVRIDDQDPVPIGADTTVTYPAFTSGLHTVSLGGLAAGCRVEGDNPRTAAVTQQGDTAQVVFAVWCAAASGVR